MELVEAAKTANDFGLRERFPWSGQTNSAPWTQDVSNDSEIDFIRKILNLSENCIIENLKRVENPYLWARYVLRHKELNAINESNSIHEEILIHATKEETAEKIADENFNWRLVRRSKYGRGVSFTNDRRHANQYVPWKTHYIIAGIYKYKTWFGRKDTIIPPEGYDTTRNSFNSVFVKYYDDEFYPYYIVELPEVSVDFQEGLPTKLNIK